MVEYEEYENPVYKNGADIESQCAFIATNDTTSNHSNNLNKSDWEITKDKCDSTRAHRRHLAANGKHEMKRKIYCTNVHLRIIEILITSVYI